MEQKRLHIRGTGQAPPANMRDLHYYALAIISYQSIAGPRRKVSDIVWVVYEYPRRRDDCGKDVWGWGRQRWPGREVFINPLSPTRVYTRRYTWSPLYILVMLFFSHPLCTHTRLWTVRVPLSTSRSSARVQRRPGLITQTRGPLWLVTRIPDITFTHVIPHQFLETKAANAWRREWG